MLSIQEISDRIGIHDVLARYCHAVDERDWQTYRTLFTEEAVIDAVVTGGIRSGVEDHVVYLQRALNSIQLSQHTILTILIDIDGDSALAKVQCICPMVVAIPEGTAQTMILGVRYRDRLSRVGGGSRISELVEENFWHFNVPEGFKF